MPETKKHMWVAISYSPLVVTRDEEGNLHTHTTELGDELARENSAVGCWICEEPLTAENVDEECPGAPSPN